MLNWFFLYQKCIKTEDKPCIKKVSFCIDCSNLQPPNRSYLVDLRNYEILILLCAFILFSRMIFGVKAENFLVLIVISAFSSVSFSILFMGMKLISEEISTFLHSRPWRKMRRTVFRDNKTVVAVDRIVSRRYRNAWWS